MRRRGGAGLWKNEEPRRWQAEPRWWQL